MGIREIVRILAAQQTVLGAVHHQSGDGHWMKMPSKAADPAESERRFHDRPVETHPAAGIRQTPESDAVDLRIEIGVPARGFDRVEKSPVTGNRVFRLRRGITSEPSPARLDRRQRKGPGTHQNGGIAGDMRRKRCHPGDDTGARNCDDESFSRASSPSRSRIIRVFEEPKRPGSRTHGVGTQPFISTGSLCSRFRLRNDIRIAPVGVRQAWFSYRTLVRDNPSHAWVEISSPYPPHRAGDGRLMVEIHS